LVNVGQTLNRGDLGSMGAVGQHQAGRYRLTVHQDGAGSAVALIATLLRTRQPGFVAQAIQERIIRLHQEQAAFAVYFERQRLFHYITLKGYQAV
jgi:hypothetical protein